MSKKTAGHNGGISAQPHFDQRAGEIQQYGTVNHALPLELEEPVRLEMTEHLNQLLADTMTLRDLYKKSHWQVAGPTFYQLHLLFDKHYGEQSELVDTIAERIQLLGGVSLAMAADIAETTRIERPPRGREEVPVQLSRLLDAHKIIIGQCRELAERADQAGRRRHQRPRSQRRPAHQRIAGMVPERAPGAHAAGHRPGLTFLYLEIRMDRADFGRPFFCWRAGVWEGHGFSRADKNSKLSRFSA